MKTGKKSRGAATKAAGKKRRPGGRTASSGSTHSRKTPQTKAKPTVTLTHEQIAQRAAHIWRQGGCIPGRDVQNWHEAEAQLRAELGGN
ncbi:MAG: DUF2934 domain-containing protein [Phycisphaerales bacterium]|nr:MAG: DUF2934 domain-containing protein [Phycisphaerales bacterium]